MIRYEMLSAVWRARMLLIQEHQRIAKLCESLPDVGNEQRKAFLFKRVGFYLHTTNTVWEAIVALVTKSKDIGLTYVCTDKGVDCHLSTGEILVSDKVLADYAYSPFEILIGMIKVAGFAVSIVITEIECICILMKECDRSLISKNEPFSFTGSSSDDILEAVCEACRIAFSTEVYHNNMNNTTQVA